MATNDLLDIIRWTVHDPYRRVVISKQGKDGKIRRTRRWEARPPGEGAISIPDKLLFVEYAVLCGLQAGQRLAKSKVYSPIVDVKMHRKAKGKKLAGWFIYRKDGTNEFLEYKPVTRRKWQPEKKPKGAAG